MFRKCVKKVFACRSKLFIHLPINNSVKDRIITWGCLWYIIQAIYFRKSSRKKTKESSNLVKPVKEKLNDESAFRLKAFINQFSFFFETPPTLILNSLLFRVLKLVLALLKWIWPSITTNFKNQTKLWYCSP